MLTSTLSHAGAVLACAGADNLVRLLERTSSKVVCVADMYTLLVHNHCFTPSVWNVCWHMQLEDATQHLHTAAVCACACVSQAMSMLTSGKVDLLFHNSHLLDLHSDS